VRSEPGSGGRGEDRPPGGGWRAGANGLRSGLSIVLPPAITFVLFLAGWQAFVVVSDAPTVVLPSPAEVAAAVVADRATLLAAGLVTGATAGLGLLVGALVGIGLAFLVVRSRALESVVVPYVVALRIAPVIAIAPLLFLWFGRGIPTKALLVATLALFPMTVATIDGLRSTPRPYLLLLESVGASSWTTFARVRLPAAAPSVFAGLKIAATLSVIGAVVAEFVTLDAGLGTRVFVASTGLRTAEAYAALVALALLGIAFYAAPAAAERAVRVRFR